MAKWIEPDTYPSVNVAAATIITIPIPAEYRGQDILRVQCIPTAGSATSSAPVFTEDSNADEREKQIASFSAITTSAPVDHDNGGSGYAWSNAENIYVKPTPNAGSDNTYKIRVLMGRKA